MTIDERELTTYAKQWLEVYRALKGGKSVDEVVKQYPVIADKFKTSTAAAPPATRSSGGPLNERVLKLLGAETGISSAEAWANIFLLVSKPEHDNDDPRKTFDSEEKGVSLFNYASALSYDWHERGVTFGIVGFTTANDGKDGDGDAPAVFEAYRKLGGADFSPMMKGCARDKGKCAALISKIHALGDDPRWIEAQWQCLCQDGGYIRETVKAFRSVGITAPSALAIGTVFDCSLNQGYDGKHGGCMTLKKLGVHGDEDATMQKFNKWRRGVAGTNDYNSPAVNGHNRADQFEKLRVAKCTSLTGCDGEIKKAIGWEMK